MSLIKFGYTVDMEALQNPAIPESFFIGYDTDGVLKQLDHLGNLTPIGSVTNVIGAESNFFLSNSGLDSLGNKTASIYRSGNLRIGTTQSYTQMSGSTFSIYNNVGGTPSLYFSVDNSLVINNNNNISGDRFYWNPSSGLQFNNNIDSNFYSGFSSTGLSFSHTDSISSITSESVSITDGDYTLSLDINQGISFGNGTVSSVISATATLFTQTSSTLTLLPTTLSGNQVQYYQNKSGTFSLISDVIDSSLFYLTGSTNSVINSKTQSIYRNGNIGIGTASPSTKLHIFATQSGAFRLQDGTQGNNYILKSDSNGIASWTPLSSVGISGSASYIPKFTGTSSLGNSNFIDNGSSGSYKSADDTVAFILGSNIFLRLLRGQSSMDFSLGNPGATVPEPGIITSYNTHGLDIKSQGYLAFSSGTSYTEAMRISSNGYVGIGLTTAPSTKLHIYATQSGYGFRLQDGTEGGGYILTSNGIGMGSWTSSISVSKFQLTGGQTGYILTSDATGVGSWTSSSTAVSYWTATGSNIINSNPTGSVIINHPAGGAYDVAFRTAAFTGYSGQSGFGVYNGGNVGGSYFYGSWFNVPVGNGIQDFTGFTRFYINSSSPYNWISNQPMVIGSTTSIPSIGTNRFVVSSSVGTASFVVSQTGNVGIGLTGPSTKLHIYATQSGAFRLEDGTQGNGYILTSDTNGVASWTASVSGGGISGTGTTNYLPKFTGSTSLGNSTITDTGSIVNINSKLIIDTSLGVYTTKTGWDTYSTGFGYQALNNSTGERNTAFGYRASSGNTTGGYNSSFGQFALFSSTQSMENTAVGAGSLAWLTTGDRNIGIGRNAGAGADTSWVNMSDSIFIGYLTTPANNGETNQIVIGNSQAGNGSNSVTLGNSSITKTILRGNIGLGTASPSTKLHIFATQSGAFRLQDGTQQPGYVLTSDTNGVASWTNPTSTFYIQGGTTYSFDTTSAIYRTGSLNIGTGSVSNSRFVVSSSGGTVSLVVTENGSVYNRGGRNIDSNLAFGSGALINNVSGFSNVAIGLSSSIANLTGFSNVAIGANTLMTSTNSTYNVAIGENALNSLTNGTQNTAVGAFALYIATGSYNTGVGSSALLNLTTGNYNTALGKSALESRVGTVTGQYNIGIGFQSGRAITSGSNNILIENTTGDGISSGNNNIIINPVQVSGVTTGSNNVIIGGYSNAFSSTMSNTMVLGLGSGTTRFFSDSSGKTTISDTLYNTSFLSNLEVISASVSATASLVVYDYSLSSIFYHATASTNFTANFTNLPTTNNRVLSATIVISQGATAYIPNIVQITGVTQSIKWAGGTQSGTANSLDLISFNFIRTGNVWTSVIGQIAPFS